MRRIAILTLILCLLSSCAAPAETPEDPPENPEASASGEDVPTETDETEDHVLLTLEAPLADGRTLTLEAFGRQTDEYHYGVREVRVYDGENLLQTVLAYEAIEMVWGSAADDLIGEYTSCWSAEESLETLDLNFDGNMDFGLFGWSPNNTIPYYYWTWDTEAEEYCYACTLQGVVANPETGEVVSEYKSGSAGSHHIYDYYRPDKDGVLYMTRHEISIYAQVMPDQDTERPFIEIWEPREGVVIRPVVWYDGDLILVRQERPLREIQEDSTISRYTEVWELKDGVFQMTSREEYIDGNQS